MNYAKLNICSNRVWGVLGVPGAAPFGCLADAEQDTIDPHHDVKKILKKCTVHVPPPTRFRLLLYLHNRGQTSAGQRNPEKLKNNGGFQLVSRGYSCWTLFCRVTQPWTEANCARNLGQNAMCTAAASVSSSGPEDAEKWGGKTRIGLSVYRCLAAGIRQRTTVCERCSELDTVVFYGCFLVIEAHGGRCFRTPTVVLPVRR